MNKTIAVVLIQISALCYGSEVENNYSGTYVFGAEVQSFKPCNEKTNFWVSFDWAGIEMHKFYQEFQTEPYQAMYIEFRGQVLDEVVDGFAEDYTGLIRISEVKKLLLRFPQRAIKNSQQVAANDQLPLRYSWRVRRALYSG